MQIWNAGDWLALLTRPIPAGEWTDIALVFGDESMVSGYNQWWYSCHAGVVLYLFDFAGKNGL